MKARVADKPHCPKGYARCKEMVLKVGKGHISSLSRCGPTGPHVWPVNRLADYNT